MALAPGTSGKVRPAFFLANVIPFSITSCVFAVRLFARWRRETYGLDDLMLLIAFATLAVHTTFCLIAVHYGYGKSRALLTPENTTEALKWFYMLQASYKVLGTFVKLSFLFLYLRIFKVPRFQFWVKLVMAYVIGGGIAFLLGSVFECIPIRLAWEPQYPWNPVKVNGTCVNLLAFWLSHSLWAAIGDIIIFIMPIFVVKDLQMPTSRKVGLCSLFAMGLFTCIAGIMRMTFLTDSYRTSDATYGTVNANIWTSIEANFSVTCACLPAIRGPLVGLFKKVFGIKSTPAYSSYKMQSRPSRREAGVPGSGDYWRDYNQTRSGYETKFGPEDSLEDGYHNSSQERIVGIVKTTDFKIMRRDSSDETSVPAETYLPPAKVREATSRL